MNLDHCKELVVLADLLSFSKAADRLYITQSTLSKHVAALEREAGFRIFDRSTSYVELTESGKVYIEYIREAVEKCDQALYQAKLCQGSSNSQVRVTGPLLNDELVSLVLAAQSDVQQTGLVLETLLSDIGVRDSHDSIRKGQADVAIAFRYRNYEPGLVQTHLFDIPFGIVCRKRNHLADKRPLVFEDFIGARFISYPLTDRDNYHDYVGKVCKKYKLASSIEYLDDNFLCFPDVDDKIVFGIYYAGYSLYGNDMVVRPLDDRRDVFNVCVVRREDEQNEATLAFYDRVIQRAQTYC